MIWTLGAGLEQTDVPRRRETELTPKFGVEYRATDRLTVRGAAFRTVKANVVAQQTIQPTLVAGFNQLYDDFNGTKADQGSVGLDFKFRPDLTIGIEAIYRDISAPEINNDAEDTDIVVDDASEGLGQAYLYWTPTDRIAVSFALRGDHYKAHANDAEFVPQDIDSILAPLSVRYFDPSGFFAVAGIQYVGQSVTTDDGAGQESNQWGDSWLVDASIGFRLPNRRGIVSLELNNLLDQNIHWQDDTFRSSEQQSRRFVPERSAMARLNLNF